MPAKQKPNPAAPANPLDELISDVAKEVEAASAANAATADATTPPKLALVESNPTPAPAPAPAPAPTPALTPAPDQKSLVRQILEAKIAHSDARDMEDRFAEDFRIADLKLKRAQQNSAEQLGFLRQLQQQHQQNGG